MFGFGKKEEEINQPEEENNSEVKIMISRIITNYVFVRADNYEIEEHHYYFDFDKADDAEKALSSLEKDNKFFVDNKVFDINTSMIDKKLLIRDMYIVPAEKGCEP